jgi:hypothetical protein
VLKGKAIVDGLTLGPLDVILGPSNEPHGPLNYPDGCMLLSAFQGSYYHSEVEKLSTEKHYRLIQHDKLPWTKLSSGGEVKTLVDHGLDRMLIEAWRFPAGTSIKPPFLAALVVDGAPEVNGETLDVWDFVYRKVDGPSGEIAFPKGGTLLAITMR